jgi:hypothetical protein
MATPIERAFPVDVRLLVRAGAGAGTLRRGTNLLGYTVNLASLRLTVYGSCDGIPFAECAGLSATYPHYGGARWWAKCPGCGRRCAILHFVGPGRLGCRVCLHLAYESTRETAFARACRRARRIRFRLGASTNLVGPLEKPKGMHWRTFWELARREGAAASVALGQRRRGRGL